MLRTVALCALLALPAAAQAQTEDDLRAMGAYIAAEDVAVSTLFYATLLGRQPVIALHDFVAFDIAGGWFAVVSRGRYAPDAIPGSGAVPYIRSDDLRLVQARAAFASGRAAPPIIKEPGIEILKVTGPDGQRVEFFRLTAD